MFNEPYGFHISHSTFIENNNASGEKDSFYEVCKRLASTFEKGHSRGKQNHNSETRDKKTGAWLQEEEIFVTWRREGSEFPILWVHGQPGSGKSTLCSHAIDVINQEDLSGDIPQKEHSIALSYYYCSVEEECGHEDVLGFIAYQLLSKYNAHLIPSNILALPPLRTKESFHLKSLIEAIVGGSSRVYFFIDGLDEELEGNSMSWRNGFKEVIQFMISLANKFPTIVRLWLSSQNMESVRNVIQNNAVFRELDITPFSEADIKIYLANAVDKIHGTGASSTNHTDILTVLQSRAKCSFIWAKLMMLELQRGATSVSSMKSLLEESFPKNLDTYYQRIFSRMENQYKQIARQVFSLVVYARRPLRFAEIFEAMWCLNSKSKAVLNPNDQIFKSSIHRVFEPCIEKISNENDSENDGNHTCHLIHSTLRTFLLRNPQILCSGDEETPSICPQIWAEACLTYLRQDRYSALLQKLDYNTWTDKNGDSVKDHHLLVYAAKYWDKHVSEISDNKTLEVYSKLIEEFLLSPQFITCIQVQSIWVEAQFEVFHIKDIDLPFLRRHLPSWFSMENSLGQRLWKHYRELLHDWLFFLSCGACGWSQDCPIAHYLGQVDRVWFGALGKENFLRKFASKYNAFAFELDASESEKVAYCVEHVDGIGENLYAIQILIKDKVVNSPTFNFTFRHWKLSQNFPTIIRSENINVNLRDSNLELYMLHGKGASALISFSSNAEVLRIGNKIFRRNQNGKFYRLPQLGEYNFPYIEDIEYRSSDRTLVLTSRTQLSRRELSRLKRDLWDQLDELNEGEDEDMSDSDSDEFLDWSSGDGIDSDSDDCSSLRSSDSEFENDKDVPWPSYFEGQDHRLPISDDESESDPGDAPLRTSQGIYDDISSESSSSEDGNNGQEQRKERKTSSAIDSDEDTVSSNDSARDFVSTFTDTLSGMEEKYDWNKLPKFMSDKEAQSRKPRASIMVFNIRFPEEPSLLFQKRLPLKCKLYGSPPVMHPTKSLIVWPLADGDVMFVDFERNTYYTRRLRPSTPDTRHVFMKCHFSDNGKYLHIISLEAQSLDVKGDAPADTDVSGIKLASLTSTYQLSDKKPTRTAPRLIHRAKLNVGATKMIPVLRLPFTVTWTERYAYLTISHETLRTYRISLFSSEDVSTTREAEEEIPESENAIYTLKETVILPSTATERQVFFFPAGGKESNLLPSRIIIGGNDEQVKDFEAHQMEKLHMEVIYNRILERQLLTSYTPAIGCNLSKDDEELFCGWELSSDKAEILANTGVGQLGRRVEGMERFTQDDCDLEPYLY